MHCSEEHTWKISGFSEKLRQAKSEGKTSIESAQFHTGEYGYKCKIRLYPNGVGTGKTLTSLFSLF